MKMRWGKKEENVIADPKEGEIYLKKDGQQILLMQGHYFSNGNAYYQYTTFQNHKSIKGMMLQHEFYSLRQKQQIVKIKIDRVELSRII